MEAGPTYLGTATSRVSRYSLWTTTSSLETIPTRDFVDKFPLQFQVGKRFIQPTNLNDIYTPSCATYIFFLCIPAKLPLARLYPWAFCFWIESILFISLTSASTTSVTFPSWPHLAASQVHP
jgi:hypothetical protein